MGVWEYFWGSTFKSLIFTKAFKTCQNLKFLENIPQNFASLKVTRKKIGLLIWKYRKTVFVAIKAWRKKFRWNQKRNLFFHSQIHSWWWKNAITKIYSPPSFSQDLEKFARKIITLLSQKEKNSLNFYEAKNIKQHTPLRQENKERNY